MKLSRGRRQALLTGSAALIAPIFATSCASIPSRPPARRNAANATVVGPVTGGDKGWIYRAPVIDLAAAGYVIEEFFVSGAARSFRLADGETATFDGDWTTQADQTAPFTTRIFVARPSDPAKYNGVLLAHWQNVSAGYENGWPTDAILGGYAWMAVSAQADGINGGAGKAQYGLRQWDNARYGALDHPGDAFSYDIFATAVSAALGRSAQAPGGPLANLKTETVIALGGSQSALRLATFINGVHSHRRVFDGYLLLSHFGVAPPFEERSLISLFDIAGGGRNAAWSQIADRGDAPVLVVDTQAEALMHYRARQPDTASFRTWEIAGAPHAPPSATHMKDVAGKRDGVVDGGPAPSTRNVVEWGYASDAAIRFLARWIRDGAEPPRFEPLTIDLSGSHPSYALDDVGNVIGGIRPPEVAAAIGVHSAGLPPANALLGRSVLFDRQRMIEQHGDRRHFLASWNDAVAKLEAAGLLLPVESQQVRARAAEYWPAD
ncbi:MAG: hypothetical protein GC203_22820 [Phenylobacterium sp.]|uniref:alpha/beta hydrolase domain-containing protein n=1 Tax=Phenylobacterium sp. TaxID=1871053 RepID=UPI0025F09BB0|nr:alpha/beta hydrolase domain-containing protein [Phenylobacterium sp.]MBI1200706.1 hypothetical protein [Phenylobacterium sp.]